LRGGCDFSFFVRSYFGLHRFPVDLNVLRKLPELLIGFFTLVHLQEPLSVGYYSIDMRFVVDCDFESAVPFVHLDVKFNSAIVQSSRQKNLFSFRDLLLVHGKSSVSCWFTGKFFHVVDELNFISFIDCGKCDFDGVKFSLEYCHRSKGCPKCMFFYKTTEPDCFLKICLVYVLV
jgi:hypothetical protein